MIHIKSFAKVNLSLDVGEVMPNGMHPVDMIMQQISLHDDITVNVREGDSFSVLLKTNSDDIPTDRGNIAFRAAEEMIGIYTQMFPDRAKRDSQKEVCVFIEKRIPVAAGLAGGSGNAAAVIHALNAIWELGLSVVELCDIGKRLGSDVPFCIMGQAKENFVLPEGVKRDSLAATCARARGTGVELTPIVPPLKAHIIVAKPAIGVSTAEVYRGFDDCVIDKRPNNEILQDLIVCNSIASAVPEMVNVLENYTLKAYPEVQELKTFMQENLDGAAHVLMSGSGPSVFAIFTEEMDAINAMKCLQATDYEAFLCKTI